MFPLRIASATLLLTKRKLGTNHDIIDTTHASDEQIPMHMRAAEETDIIRCIDVAADFEGQRQSVTGERFPEEK